MFSKIRVIPQGPISSLLEDSKAKHVVAQNWQSVHKRTKLKNESHGDVLDEL
jgi:hypothetical protein